MELTTEYNETLHLLRNCSPAEISRLVATEIPQDRLPLTYLNSLSEEDRTVCLRATLICWVISKSTMVPREMQLRVVLADAHAKDALIAAGTGSGKTLPIALCILLDDPTANYLSITISPLKRLQVTQESDFNNRFGIPTVTINEDTPRDSEWRNENVYNTSTHQMGRARHLIVTVEQLFKSSAGHFARLGHFIRNIKIFQRHLIRINVDEAHSIYTAGIPLYGLPAFRPAWGKLDELKVLLSNKIRWKAFSATFPRHILRTVEKKILKPDYVSIRLTSNRPNTIYATHQVPGSIEDPQNYECFLMKPFDLHRQPHVLIFVDNKDLTSKIAQHLDASLPTEYYGRGIIKHYHSVMSEEYLEQTHESFVREDKICRILVATSGESVGVDFPNVKIVCTTGLPSTLVDVLQRAGRALRRSMETALFVLFYEAWALEIKETDYSGDMSDPDRPRNDLRLASRRPERAPLSAIQLVQSKTCLRRFFASYLDDTLPEALEFVTPFCCDQHNDGFSLQAYLPSKLFTQAITIISVDPQTRTQNTYRPPGERHILDDKLIAWIKMEVSQDEFCRAPYDILSDANREKLVKATFDSINSVSAISQLLGETAEWEEEWAHKIHKQIVQFQESRLGCSKPNTQKRRKAN